MNAARDFGRHEAWPDPSRRLQSQSNCGFLCRFDVYGIHFTRPDSLLDTLAKQINNSFKKYLSVRFQRNAFSLKRIRIGIIITKDRQLAGKASLMTNIITKTLSKFSFTKFKISLYNLDSWSRSIFCPAIWCWWVNVCVSYRNFASTNENIIFAKTKLYTVPIFHTSLKLLINSVTIIT